MQVEFEVKNHDGVISAHRREMSGIPRPDDVVEVDGARFTVTEIVWTLGQCGVDLRVRARP